MYKIFKRYKKIKFLHIQYLEIKDWKKLKKMICHQSGAFSH